MSSVKPASPVVPAAKTSLGTRLINRKKWLAPLMILPAVLYVVVLVGFPFVLALLYSISNVTVGSREFTFVGFYNFRSIMQNPHFWTSLINTFIFTFVSQILVVVLGK